MGIKTQNPTKEFSFQHPLIGKFEYDRRLSKITLRTAKMKNEGDEYTIILSSTKRSRSTQKMRDNIKQIADSLVYVGNYLKKQDIRKYDASIDKAFKVTNS